MTQRGRKSGKAAGNRGLIYGTKPGHRAKPLLHSIIGLLVAQALLLLLAGTDRRRMLAKSTAADLQHPTIKGAEDFCQHAWQRSPMMHLHAHAQEVQHMQQWAEQCSAVGANRLASSRLPNNGSVASRTGACHSRERGHHGRSQVARTLPQGAQIEDFACTNHACRLSGHLSGEPGRAAGLHEYDGWTCSSPGVHACRATSYRHPAPRSPQATSQQQAVTDRLLLATLQHPAGTHTHPPGCAPSR